MYPFLKQAFFKISLALCCIIASIVSLNAQQSIFSFSPLGSKIYTEKIKQLEKYVVPKNYSDKSSQAWYEEILTGRNKAILSAFKDDDILYDTLLLNKCNSVLKRISQANPTFKFDTIKLYINRSIVANAACYGEGTIMVNLGLFLWLDNDDELALVVAHEISHQLLNHSDQKMQKSISTLTSDEFKEELKNIKKADYGKFDRFRKLMKGLTIEAGKHSTYKESEADSLAVILAKNANYNISYAAKVLLKLDHVDDLFTSDKLYTLKDVINNAPIDFSFFNTKTKYKGLSSVNVTMNADKDFDSVKTHPDCSKRYETIAGKNNSTVICCTNLSNDYKNYKERAMIEIVRHLYENGAMGLCIHLSAFALKNQYEPSFYKYMLSMCFSKIYYNDKNLKRFNSVNTYADKGTNLKELQDYLFSVSTKDLEVLALYFLNTTAETNSEDYEFANTMYQTQVKEKETVIAYTAFNTKFPNSKYSYLIQPKKEK